MFRSRSLRASAGLLLLSCALACAPLTAQTPLHTASRTELDVVKVLLTQEAAWNRGDIEGFAQGYKHSPDTLFVTRQISRGWDGLVQEYKLEYPTKAAMGTLAFSELEVYGIDEKVAVCVGKYHLERGKKEGGNADGIFSLVLEKTDQGWKIVVDHTT